MSAPWAKSNANMKSSERTAGFTLIEVLVALSVVVIAFMAMYGSMIQVIAAMTLMQEKTIASWIAFDRITELRVSGQFPDEGDNTGEIEMAKGEWVYTAVVKDTGSADIRQVIVSVAPAQDPDNIMATATGAVVRPVAPATAPGGLIPGGSNQGGEPGELQ